jgi:hypothetical protein
MIYIDCYYYGFYINYEELKKYNIKQINLKSNIKYTSFEKQKLLIENDDEINKILKNVEKKESFKSTLTKKQSYCSIQDKLIYLKL